MQLQPYRLSQAPVAQAAAQQQAFGIKRAKKLGHVALQLEPKDFPPASGNPIKWGIEKLQQIDQQSSNEKMLLFMPSLNELSRILNKDNREVAFMVSNSPELRGRSKLGIILKDSLRCLDMKDRVF